MLKQLNTWFRLKAAYRELGKRPDSSATALVVKQNWLEDLDMAHYFGRQFVADEALRMLESLKSIVTSDSPIIANRRALGGAVSQYSKFLVLAIEPEPVAETAAFKGAPGITGRMREHLHELAKVEPLVQELCEAFEENTTYALWNAVHLQYARTKVWAQLFNAARQDLGDFVGAGEVDWYHPFVASAAAVYEHECRKALRMPAALDNTDGDADVRAIMLGCYVQRVKEGHIFPVKVWKAASPKTSAWMGGP